MKVSLLGSYQPKNASLVIDAVALLRGRGLAIDDGALRRGLEDAVWRARFEIIALDPMIIFDGAHNPQGIDVAVDSIKQYFGTKKVVIFTGVLRDKDYSYIASRLSEVASRAFTITPDNPRALSAEEYSATLRLLGVCAEPCKSIGEALSRGAQAAEEENTALCCLGSLYTYVDVINSLKKG